MMVLPILTRVYEMNRGIGFAVIAAMFIGWAGAPGRAEANAPGLVIAQGASSAEPKPAEPASEKAQETAVDNSPGAIMSRRFPQKVRVGDLIGLPMLDDNDVTLGRVERVVRTPQGKIELIVGYSKWFGWFGRPVAVPIEVVAILGRQIASLDMSPAEYAAAPTWTEGKDMPIPENDTIRIAITRR
jgi:PRC-barrel domain